MFEKPSDVDLVLKKQDWLFWWRFKKFCFPMCRDAQSLWRFMECPEPVDICFENMHYSSFNRFYRFMIGMYISNYVMMFFFPMLLGVKIIQSEFVNKGLSNIQEKVMPNGWVTKFQTVKDTNKDNIKALFG